MLAHLHICTYNNLPDCFSTEIQAQLNFNRGGQFGLCPHSISWPKG